MAAHHCRVKFQLNRNTITCGGKSIGWNGRRVICRLMRSGIQDTYVDRLMQASDQGRAMGCASSHPSSNHWITTGDYTSFGEYRFALKARLNLLPTRTVLRRARVYRLSSSPHVPSSRCTGRSSLQQKHGHCVVHACHIYSWTKTNYRRCARYVYLHLAPFCLLMMQHNSYVSSSIISVMPHDCMAFSYFIHLSVGRWCSLQWTAFSYVDDTLIKRIAVIHIHIYMTAAQVKHNGDRSPDVPRDADPVVVYASLHQYIVVAW